MSLEVSPACGNLYVNKEIEMSNNYLKVFGIATGIAIGTISGTVDAGIDDRNKNGLNPHQRPSKVAVNHGGSFESSRKGSFVSPKGSSTNPKVHGKTYGEWAAKWAKWAYSYPTGKNPIQDQTGAYCDKGQSGKVWFLAGSEGLTGVERKCTIPAGKAIFFPIISSTWVDVPGDEIYSDEEVRWIMASLTPGGDLACKITSTLDTFTDLPNLDEVPAPLTARLRPVVRAQSPKSTIVLPEDSLFADVGGLPGLNERLIVEGYWVMLPPLKPGKHVLRLNGAGCEAVDDGETGFTKTFETEVTYHLRVTRGKNH